MANDGIERLTPDRERERNAGPSIVGTYIGALSRRSTVLAVSRPWQVQARHVGRAEVPDLGHARPTPR